jgi:hypothetical protein
LLEHLEFIEALQNLQSTADPKGFVDNKQISSLIDKYQNKADEIDRLMFQSYHGE